MVEKNNYFLTYKLILMKNLFFVLLAVMMLSCKKEESLIGMNMKNFTVTSFPSTDGGAGWDVINSNPDIFIEVTQGSDVLLSTTYYLNAVNTNEYSWNDFVSLTDPGAVYTVSLYDYDDVLPHDFLGSVSFIPKDQDLKSNSLIFENGAFRFAASVEFIFD